MTEYMQVCVHQRRKYTRSKGKLPIGNIILLLISREEGQQNALIMSFNNYDNLIAFCFSSLFCVLSVLPVLGRNYNKESK